jgi:hypothetical protein
MKTNKAVKARALPRRRRLRVKGWDLRVVENVDGKGVEVCEVFYDTKGVPCAWSSGISVGAETVAGIRFTQRQIGRALRAPTLVQKKRGNVFALVPKRDPRG